jgi:anionic cell wall polymer biosynthesis LytR-Cps2A-Psr (LCP) family protein
LNFNGFIDIVNALDGITVDVPIHIVEQNSTDQSGAIVLEPGIQTLHGEEALALARTRKVDNDIQRGKRQQLLLKAILSKALSFNSVAKYSNLIDAVGKNMTTNLSFEEMQAFLQYTASFQKNNIEQISLTGSNYILNGKYYLKLDPNQLKEVRGKLQTHLDFSTTK